MNHDIAKAALWFSTGMLLMTLVAEKFVERRAVEYGRGAYSETTGEFSWIKRAGSE